MYNSQWDQDNNPYRSLNYLPGEPAGNGGPGSLPENANYGTLISQEVHQWENDEFRVTGFALDASVQALEIHVLETRDEYNVNQSLVAAGSGAVGAGIGTSAAKLAGAVGTSINASRGTQAAIATTTFYGTNAALNSGLAVGTGYVTAQVNDTEYMASDMVRDEVSSPSPSKLRPE
ncbi:hypothetical protein E4656_12635 [Natronospirillum operosum]|uniref:Uncharacterized protein n=1 Tax=Natronospirillum operosum TaxID=2759953 RepID=A0A4Z0WD89_9GAMM|nr:hypothetical protein [Natronospirillum operosum]TGG92960.1 hypothetical protein E4656_12635 [Natronospirillum operosum]